MRSKLIIGLLVGAIAFLLITNPVVSEAAGQITGKQIKNGSVTGKDIKDHSVTANDVSGSLAGATGPAGPTGPAGSTGPTGANATALWAVVELTVSAATLTRGSGATSSTRSSTGTALVTFNRPILNCAYVATAGATGGNGALNDYATVEQANALTSPNVLEIRVRNDSGTPVDPGTGEGFHLAVFCP